MHTRAHICTWSKEKREGERGKNKEKDALKRVVARSVHLFEFANEGRQLMVNR